MNSDARDFLNVLHEICKRYHVSMITVLDDSVTICRNGNRLSFKTYVDGQYSCVKCTENYGDYFVEDGEENDN